MTAGWEQASEGKGSLGPLTRHVPIVANMHACRQLMSLVASQVTCRLARMR